MAAKLFNHEVEGRMSNSKFELERRVRSLPIFARAVLLGMGLAALAACDGDNLFSGERPIGFAPDSALPSVTIVDPIDGSSAPLTGNLLVRADIEDNSGIKQVSFKGVAIRGDSATNTTVVNRFTEVVVTFPQAPSTTLPRDTTLLRFLTPVAGDSTSENVLIIVTVTDSLNLVRADTNRITVGGPRVTLRNPVSGSILQTGGTFQITADAVDPTVGLDSMKIYITGVITDSVVVKNLNGVPSRTIDQPFTVGTTTGAISVVARAWNRLGISGISQPSTLTIQTASVSDTQAPQLSVNMVAPERVEVDDSIELTVRAADVGSSGLARVGVTIIAFTDTISERADTLFRDTTFAPPRGGTLDKPFNFRLTDFLEEETAGAPSRFAENSSLRFPRRFTLEVHAFAIDGSGNCAAAVSSTTQSLPCLATPSAPPAPIPNTFRVASAPSGLQASVTATAGSSINLPAGGTIADAIVDDKRERVYLSNITGNRLEVLNVTGTGINAARVCAAPTPASQPCFMPVGGGGVGLVGSSPWGLSFNQDSSRLLVANSGGTNLSFVQLLTPGTAGDVTEIVPERILTPNTVLFDVAITKLADPSGQGKSVDRYTKTFIDFSDRPQFVAVDSAGLILYSTVPTGSAPDGTIRYAQQIPAGAQKAESKLLLPLGSTTPSPDHYAIAHIDDILFGTNSENSQVVILVDHVPGFPNNLIFSIADSIHKALPDLAAKGSDVAWETNAAWNVAAVGMTDTTFVAISTDRGRIAFGEGSTPAAGRIIMCCTKGTTATGQLVVGVSRQEPIIDLIHNANEHVLGLSLNHNGTMGVARGQNTVYFWTGDERQTDELRLQGLFAGNIAGGAGGAAIHPLQTGIIDPPPVPNANIAFAATPNNSIKIIDTIHFFERGNIPIRDNITGPLKASLPFPSDNPPGLPTTDPNYIIVKLYGVTSGGRVVIVNVRVKDLVN
jgi:hypothetical protein